MVMVKKVIFYFPQGVIECLKIVTETKSKRIAKFAFDYATKMNRKKVTAVHKANIMKLGDGLFIKCCEEVNFNCEFLSFVYFGLNVLFSMK